MEELVLPEKTGGSEELLARFRIACRRCGGSNVVANVEPAGGYSEYTQWSASVQIGCNDCGSDWHADL